MDKKRIAVIRVRGRTGIKPVIADTMKMLNLHRINNCVVISDAKTFTGMIARCKDYVTWGEVVDETVLRLLRKRGEVSEEMLKQKGFGSLEEFVKKFMNFECEMKDIGVKTFRLKPPRKGYDSVKANYPRGGLGYRGNAVNELIRAMA